MLTYDNAIHYRSFLDYENIVWLQHNSGMDVGDQLHSRHTSVVMLDVVYRSDRQEYRIFLTTISPATGRLPQVGIAADKVSSKRMKQWQCNAARVNLQGSPSTFCTELRKMGKTALGIDCFNNLAGSFADLGGKPHQRRSYCMDGEAVYSGNGTTADTVKSKVKAEDEMNGVMTDPPHCGESLNEDMREKFVYISEIHDLVKQLYSHLSFAGKKVAGLEALTKDMGVVWHEIHYLFAIRMIESEYIALKNFMADYPVIIHWLRAEVDKLSASSNGADQRQAIQMKHWIRKMRSFKFVAVTLTLLDHDKQFKIFSKATQNDFDLALDYPTSHERFKSALESAKSGKLGSHVKRNLSSLKAGKYAGIVLLGMREEVSATEENTAFDPNLFEVEALVSKRKAGRGYQYCVVKTLGRQLA